MGRFVGQNCDALEVLKLSRQGILFLVLHQSVRNMGLVCRIVVFSDGGSELEALVINSKVLRRN